MESEQQRPRPQDWRAARRAQRRREIARRRRVAAAIGAAMAAAVAVLAIVLIGAGKEGGGARSGGGEGSGREGSASTQRAGSAATGDAKGTTNHGGPSSGLPNVAHDAAASRLPVPGRDVAAPILMYHVINPPPEGAPFPGLYVPKPEFAQQMHALYQAGFYAVTLEELWSDWHEGTPLPKGKPIVISFDNGYQSQYTNAVPILRRYGWKGVENIQLSGLPPSQGGLSQGQVRGLLSAGWELDTQGYSHAELPALGAAELHFQVVTARKTVQRRYHVPARWFCYPSGHYDAAVLAAVKEAGYRGSTTVIPGWASRSDDPYRLPRLRVLGGTSGEALISLIEGTKDEEAPPPTYE